MSNVRIELPRTEDTGATEGKEKVFSVRSVSLCEARERSESFSLQK